jgi:hypothetical protein
MTEHELSRTLVKSPPELWAECSDAASLARHLDRFGEIRITRLEPEIAVAWEGERASGTLRLEPSGWGTRVILTACPESEVAPQQHAVLEAEPLPDAEPEADVVPEAKVDVAPEVEPEANAAQADLERRTRVGFFARLFGRVGKPAQALEQSGSEPAAPRRPTVESEPAMPQTPSPSATATPPDADPAPVTAASPDAHPAPSDPTAALAAALDSLGQAHHRPFSRT